MRELNHNIYKLLTNSIYGLTSSYSSLIHYWANKPQTPAEGDMWYDSETNTFSVCVRRGTELVAVQMAISNGGKWKTEDELRAEKLKEIIDGGIEEKDAIVLLDLDI
tara:strand:- start:411 stop:731 length:321 start_codon:yes stop_codon:yes gene_type:complete